jgi:hypothetical protein
MVYDTKTLEILHPVSEEDRRQFEEMMKRENQSYKKIYDFLKPIIFEKIKPLLIDKLKTVLYNKLKAKITSEENTNVS